MGFVEAEAVLQSLGVRIPPSLRNIYQELERDLNIPAPGHGNLGHWADQGVLLLNAVLTVQKAMAGSHQGKGWERFRAQYRPGKPCLSALGQLCAEERRGYRSQASSCPAKSAPLTAIRPSRIHRQRSFFEGK